MEKYYIKNNDLGKYYAKAGEGLVDKISNAYRFDREEAESILHADRRANIKMVRANKLKLLILGDARHGKDTIAEMIRDEFGLTHLSSSVAALRIFLFDVLRDKYNLYYNSLEDAYEDRVNHRDKWFNEICEYNKDNPIRLTLKILEEADIYVGLRDEREVDKAIRENVFDYIIGIYDPRKPRESSKSNTADVFKYSDIILTNSGTLEDLRNKVNKFLPLK